MRTTFKDSEIPGRIHALQPFLSVGLLPPDGDGVRHRRWWAVSGPAVEMGYLPARLHGLARQAVYVVYSYGTPIAWVLEMDESESREPYQYWVPDIGYSPTTGTHQMACVEAWAAAMKRQGTYRRWPASGREVVRVPGNAEVYGRSIRARSGGMDGARPGEVVGRCQSVYDDNLRVRGVSAYAGVSGDAMHYVPSAVHTDGHDRAHP